MRRFISKLLIYTVLVLLLSNGIATLSLYSIGKSVLYKPQLLKNGVPEKKFDYLILGSSTGLTTLDSKQIDEQLGTSGINLSMDDTSLNSHYLMLKYFFELKKETDYVVLCVLPWDLKNSSPNIGNNDYRFLSERNTNSINEYFREMPSKKTPILKHSLYLPIIAVSYYNIELFYPSIYTLLNPNNRNRFDDKGNYFYPLVNMDDNRSVKELDVVISNPYFTKIQELCKEKGVNLIVYQSPLYNTEINYYKNVYIVNHSSLLQNSEHFYDYFHVDFEGRKICSEKFATEFQTLRVK